MPRKKNNKIIILQTAYNSYSFLSLKLQWETLLEGTWCPACGSLQFKKHAQYTKYFFEDQITILRLLCVDCGRTHAVIPSFSLPGTSIGTEEAETYLLKRSQGLSRTKASEAFAGKGLSETYPQKLEKMIERAVCHAKALLPFAGEGGLGGMSWILSVTGAVKKPLLSINLVCLGNNINAVFCNRFSILFYHENNPVKHSSHNRGTVKGYVSTLDSS